MFVRTYTLRVPHNSQELIFILSVGRIMLSCFIQLINHSWTLSPLLGGSGRGKHSREQKPDQPLHLKKKKSLLISIHITLTRENKTAYCGSLMPVLILLLRFYVYKGRSFLSSYLAAHSPQVAGLKAYFCSNMNKLDDHIRSLMPYGIIRVSIWEWKYMIPLFLPVLPKRK